MCVCVCGMGGSSESHCCVIMNYNNGVQIPESVFHNSHGDPHMSYSMRERGGGSEKQVGIRANSEYNHT